MLKIKNEKDEWESLEDQYYVGPQGPQGVPGPKGDPGDSLFVEIYFDDTTYAEISAILDSGKLPYIVYSKNNEDKTIKHVYYFSGELSTNNAYYFFRTRGTEIWYCYVTEANEWLPKNSTTQERAPAGNTMQVSSYRQTDLSSAKLDATDQYPSMKVMRDYVTSVIGEIENGTY